MVKLKIIAVGKDKDQWVTEGSAHFIKLLKKFAEVKITIVASPKNSSALPVAKLKKKEAAALQKEIGSGITIGLSDSGKKMDSISFSKWLEKTVAAGGSTVNFVIGGPHGLDETFLTGCDQVVSLSPLTFSHQLVRLVLLEQLYRAFSISHGSDYHK